LTTPAGFVLPIQRWQAKAAGHGWRSEKWKTRRGHVPGPGRQPGRIPPAARLAAACAGVLLSLRQSADPTEPTGPSAGSGPQGSDDAGRPRAADAASQARRPVHRRGGRQQRTEQTIGDLDGAVRTALSVEPRDGRLCVFMPPVEEVEDYLELVAAAEVAAAGLG
jgi:uncharacterized protein (DUF2126 family)